MMLYITKNRLKRIIPLMIFVVTTFFISCKEEVKDTAKFEYDPEIVPVIDTDSVKMQISDSGMVRYVMLAKTWLMFDQAKEPYWLFPDGFYGEQLDTTFKAIITIKADTVWNYTRQKLWKMRGNVLLKNEIGETFTSEEFFWDQRTQKIYSHKYIKITRPDKGILIGNNGFESNQQMTEYTIPKAGGSEIYVNENKEAEEENVE